MATQIDEIVVQNLNKLLNRNRMERNAILAESGELVEEMRKICETHYRVPHTKHNEFIMNGNVNARRPRHLNTGHMLIGEKLSRKNRADWDDVMCVQFRFRDFNRNKDGKRKYMHNKSDSSKDFHKRQYCEIPMYDSVPNKESDLSYNVRSLPFSEKFFKRYSKDFEFKIFKQFRLVIAPSFRRYKGLIDRYKDVRRERTEALRFFAREAELEIERPWNCKIGVIEAAIAAQYPDVNL